MNYLTLEAAKELVGKTIRWTAPGYDANGNYHGIDKITYVNPEDRRPIKAESLEGDQLWVAFKEPNSNGLCYSDSGRYVTFEVV